jgi:hypothetical protein
MTRRFRWHSFAAEDEKLLDVVHDDGYTTL